MIGFLFFFSIVVLSQASTLIRFAEASSLAICFWRLLMATLLLFPFVFRGDRLRHVRTLDRKDTAHFLLSGLFLFTHFYFFFRAVQETTVANSTVLLSLSPVTTAIGAYFLFQDRFNKHLIFSCLLGFSGVAILFSGNLTASPSHSPSSLSGDAWALLSALCFSGYILTGKHVRQKLSNIVYTTGVYAQTALYAAILMVLRDIPFTGYSTQTWWAFLALAVLPTLMGHAIFTYCLNFLDVNFMSCAKLIEPILAAVAAQILFNEPFTDRAIYGFLLTCAAVLALYYPLLRRWLLHHPRRN